MPDARPTSYYVKALGDEWAFPELGLARDFARQLRERGHVVEVWVRHGAAGGRLHA